MNRKIYIYEEDFKIAKNISSRYGFKLNNRILDNGSKLNIKDSLLCSIYSKLGLHKELSFRSKYFNKPIFTFTGAGGEMIRAKYSYPIEKIIEKFTKGWNKKFYNSSLRLCNRSIALLKKKTYDNDYEISNNFYFDMIKRHHFGKEAVLEFLVNIYKIQPLIDPDIKRIKFEISENSCHDLIAFIYVRFAHDLIYIPFDSKKKLNLQSIKKAEKLNKKFKPYKIKKDYNINFYIDIKRKMPTLPSKDNQKTETLVRKLFKSSKFINIINKLYDNTISNFAKEYSNKTSHHSLKYGYGLLAVAKTLEDISLNEIFLKNMSNENNLKEEKLIETIISRDFL